MKIEGLDKNLIHRRYQRDEQVRFQKRLEEIKHRRPLYIVNTNIPILPIIQSSRVARINQSKQLAEENKTMKSRLEKLSQGKSEYSFRKSPKKKRIVSP